MKKEIKTIVVLPEKYVEAELKLVYEKDVIDVYLNGMHIFSAD